MTVTIQSTPDEHGNLWFGVYTPSGKHGNDFASIDATMGYVRSLLTEKAP